MAASCSVETAASNALCGGIFADALFVGGMAWQSFSGNAKLVCATFLNLLPIQSNCEAPCPVHSFDNAAVEGLISADQADASVRSRAPSTTLVPAATFSPTTLPSKGEVTLTSIFMALMVHRVSPAATS